ncbi:hypothetical protein [Methanomethylovorans sp.]|uniref:hypothetical protein n=1 Tax=Methanomethylovorans sp. TaxID=2758717 RepID=UPI00351C4B90
MIFLNDNDVEMLPSFLSELGIRYSKQLYKKIEEFHPGNIRIIAIEHEHLKSIKERTTGTHFKDNNDERIYFELMTNLSDLVPIVFYTSDNEFRKKINRSYSACTAYYGFAESSFSCEIVD